MAAGATREKDLSWLDWSLPVDISPDGKTVLFDEQGEEGGPTYTAAVRDMQGSPPIPLGEGMAGDFSPDGKWVITTISYTQVELLPTGAGTIRKIDPGGIQQYRHVLHWMPDGKHILFSGNQPGRPARCFIQDIDGGKPRPITPEGRGRLPGLSRWAADCCHRSERGARSGSIRWTAARPAPSLGCCPGRRLSGPRTRASPTSIRG